MLRSDLAPIPLTLEAEIRVDSDDELEIIKSELVQNAVAQGDSVAAAVRLIAMLKPMVKVTWLKSKAIIKRNASLKEIYAACGATLNGVQGDTKIPRFVCLAGEARSAGVTGGASSRSASSRLLVVAT